MNSSGNYAIVPNVAGILPNSADDQVHATLPRVPSCLNETAQAAEDSDGHIRSTHTPIGRPLDLGLYGANNFRQFPVFLEAASNFFLLHPDRFARRYPKHVAISRWVIPA